MALKEWLDKITAVFSSKPNPSQNDPNAPPEESFMDRTKRKLSDVSDQVKVKMKEKEQELKTLAADREKYKEKAKEGFKKAWGSVKPGKSDAVEKTEEEPKDPPSSENKP